MYNWESLEAFFSQLNSNVKYAVLRNYEDLSLEITSSLHPDIDLLCEDAKKLIEAARSERRGKKSRHLAHQKIMIRNKVIALDVRSTGDGYYDARWEKAMLDTRVLKDGMYVLEDTEYFYSLLYHVLIQKEKISDEYYNRLMKMAEDCDISVDKESLLSCLEAYMRENGYHYTYPASCATRFFVDKVDGSLIEKNPYKCLKRKVWKRIYRK
jgi:hypothetical protein